MKNRCLPNLSNEDGFVLVTALIIMIVLVLFGTFAMNTTNIEIQIAGNDKVSKEDFFNQESCIANGKFQFRTWLTSAYLNAAENSAYFPQPGQDADNNGVLDTLDSQCWFPPPPALPPPAPQPVVRGEYRVRNIEDSNTPIAGWADIADFGGAAGAANHPANRFPTLAHIDKPDPISLEQLMAGNEGYDPKNFLIRRYVVTSYSPEGDRNTILQQGVFKVFNNYK